MVLPAVAIVIHTARVARRGITGRFRTNHHKRPISVLFAIRNPSLTELHIHDLKSLRSALRSSQTSSATKLRDISTPSGVGEVSGGCVEGGNAPFDMRR